MIGKGISFNSLHSYRDLNLILSAVSIPPAIPKTSFVDVPGADGTLDLTEAHGEVKYNDRDSAQFVFTMNPADDLSDYAFECKKTEVSNALNGVYFEQIILDKDPDYYYTGRCAVNEYLSDRRIRQIVVKARLKPYKHKVEETVVTTILSTTEKTVVLSNSRESVIPEITCTDDDTKIVFGTDEIVLNAGTHKFLGFILKEGEHTLKVRNTKNHVPYPYYETTHVQNGISYTDNGDGSVKASGTATKTSYFLFRYRDNFYLDAGEYEFSSGLVGGSKDTYFINLYRLTENGVSRMHLMADIGNGGAFSIESRAAVGIELIVRQDVSCDITVNPILRKTDSSVTFRYREGEL